jgi:hypothetical protein
MKEINLRSQELTTEEKAELENEHGDAWEEFLKFRAYLPNYFRFRKKTLCCNLEHLRPSHTESLVREKRVYQYERLQGYYYTVAMRLGNIASVLCETSLSTSHAIFLRNISTFYLFTRPVLDNLAGFSSILWQGSKFNENENVRFSKMDTNSLDAMIGKELREKVDEVLVIRDVVTHRPHNVFFVLNNIMYFPNPANLGTVDRQTGKRQLGSPSDYGMWRKKLHDFLTGREKWIDIFNRAKNDFCVLTQVVNKVFGEALTQYDMYLRNSFLRFIENYGEQLIEEDSSIPPGATSILCLCPQCKDKGLYSSRTIQDIQQGHWRCETKIAGNVCNNKMIKLFYVGGRVIR